MEAKCGNFDAVDDEAIVIRILAINDVYELNYLPHFCSAKRVESVGPTLTIATLAGDFLAPSLLSSLDKGYGKVDCMNMCGIDYVCIGNHEDDVPLDQLHNRLQESKFCWINSNMPTLPLPPNHAPLPEYVVLEAKNSSQVRRLALLGLNTNDPSLYKPMSFGGCVIEDVDETAARLYAQIMSTERVDTIVPMTHQAVSRDRETARKGIGFPVIIGGHDHTACFEYVNNCHIIKSSMDAENFAVIDFVWASAAQVEPTVHVCLKNTLDYPADPEVLHTATMHEQVTRELGCAKLYSIPEGVLLTSRGGRLQQTSMGSLMTTITRNALNCDCCCLCGGGIRADKSYEGLSEFTYAHLKAELPFDTNIAVVSLPGKIISELIEFTRAYASLDPPQAKGFFMQVDIGIRWDAATNRVLGIGGMPVDPHRMYSIAMNVQVLQGLDGITPVLDYIREHPVNIAALQASAIELREILVGYFTKTAFYSLLKRHQFQGIDTLKDGHLDVDELEAVLSCSSEGKSSCNALMLHNLLNIADVHHLKHVDKIDALRIGLCMWDDELHHAKDSAVALSQDSEGVLSLSPLGLAEDGAASASSSVAAVSGKGLHAPDHYSHDDISAQARLLLGDDAWDEALVTMLIRQLDPEGTGRVTHDTLAALVIVAGEVHTLII